ncbi:MAG TPA: OmpA family protein, partial [Treponema sp.]|nr:OmpA family protein [Treponema sp.]
YKENFKILIKTALGNTYEFSGFAESEISELKKVPQKTVEDAIKNLNLENTSVVQDERGLTITIENIQFLADSAILLAKEKEKLIKLAEILKDFPNNDLLISGHTALAGSEAARLKLSKERAQAVANFLVSIGLKDAYHIFTQGFGAEKPIAPNETEAGKAKNRRVEITILEN